MSLRPAALLVALLAALPGPVAGQFEDEPIHLDFRDMELPDVIEFIAKLTNRNILYDDRVRGRVTLISPNP
ncbi:MAG: hypothetical protein V3T14_01710, partial [Myxococcota bacterium]